MTKTEAAAILTCDSPIEVLSVEATFGAGGQDAVNVVRFVNLSEEPAITEYAAIFYGADGEVCVELA